MYVYVYTTHTHIHTYEGDSLRNQNRDLTYETGVTDGYVLLLEDRIESMSLGSISSALNCQTISPWPI